MSKARNGNRKCPNCTHFIAAHGYALGTNQRPCCVTGCNCIWVTRTACEADVGKPQLTQRVKS